jgi:hypothetical protein
VAVLFAADAAAARQLLDKHRPRCPFRLARPPAAGSA